jgi:hypothetical protein
VIGAGKYDDEATLVRERTKAAGVIVIVLGGDKGQGFACQLDAAATLAVPTMLRVVADQIEADFKRMNGFGRP